MDRRTFLRATAIGGGVTVAAGAGIALQGSELRYAPRTPTFVLDPTQFALVAAIAARTTGAADVDPVTVAHAADSALRFVAPEAVEELGQVLTLLENGLAGLLLRGSPRPFSKLSPADQDHALARWMDSRVDLVRGAGQALRKLTLGSYYAPLEAAKQTGYPGPLFEKPDPGPITPRGALSEPFVPQADTATAATPAATDAASKPGALAPDAPAPAAASAEPTGERGVLR